MWNYILYFIQAIASVLLTVFPIIDVLFNLNHAAYIVGRCLMYGWGFWLRTCHNGRLCSGDFYDGEEEFPEPYQWK